MQMAIVPANDMGAHFGWSRQAEQHLNHRTQLRVLRPQRNDLRSKLLKRRELGQHHTMINDQQPRSTNHAQDLTSYQR